MNNLSALNKILHQSKLTILLWIASLTLCVTFYWFLLLNLADGKCWDDVWCDNLRPSVCAKKRSGLLDWHLHKKFESKQQTEIQCFCFAPISLCAAFYFPLCLTLKQQKRDCVISRLILPCFFVLSSKKTILF